MNKKFLSRLDWLSILIFLILVGFGILNIYSATYSEFSISIFNSGNPAGKQFWIFLISLIVMPFILFVKTSFFEHLSNIFYGISLISLIGLLFFGQKISGATSWYTFGGFSFQPSEFAKVTTALLIATNLSSIQTDIKKVKDILKLFSIILFPMFLIILQSDAGSAIVFFGIVFAFLREGLDMKFLYFSFLSSFIFVLTLLLKPLLLSLILILIFTIIYRYLVSKFPKTNKSPFLIVLITAIIFSFSVDFIFNTIFEQRHRDRFNVILGIETDSKGIGYNINQSKIAIGSGGLDGKGYLNGTQTKGGFVPEQHTDYIFSTVGEEWGFIGSSSLIIFYTFLMLRILSRAEKHTQSFPRIFSYSFVGMLFIHFLVNIGMTLGLFPTVGIPLPFISYGGTNLLAFSLMFFIYLNYDANRLN